MDGKFESSLALSSDGKKVEARGPLHWDAGDTGASLYVAIMQGTVVAVGDVDGLTPAVAQFTAEATVDGQGTFSEGPAFATGWAFVRGHGIEMYSWSVPVTLSKSIARSDSGDVDRALAGQLRGAR